MPKYFVFQKDSTYGECQSFIKLYFKYDPFKTLSIIEKESTEIAQQQQMFNSFSLYLLFLMQERSSYTTCNVKNEHKSAFMGLYRHHY